MQTKVGKMMDTPTAAMLSNYNAWADEALFAAIARLPREHLYRQTKMLFGSVIGMINHKYQVDVICRANILGKEHSFSNRREVLHPEAVEMTKVNPTAGLYAPLRVVVYANQRRGATIEYTGRGAIRSVQKRRDRRDGAIARSAATYLFEESDHVGAR
jgi:hypothetical protein